MARLSVPVFTILAQAFALALGSGGQSTQAQDQSEVLRPIPMTVVPAMPNEKAIIIETRSAAVSLNTVRQRFSLPVITPLQERSEPNKSSISQQDSEWTHAATFGRSCKFSYGERGSYGQELTGSTLLIYEGMQLFANRDGTYLLSFIAKPPASHVALELQLKVAIPNYQPAVYLTVPIINFELASNGTQRSLTGAKQVTFEGNSAALQKALSESQKRFSDAGIAPLQVYRSGRARFGTYPGRANFAATATKSAGTP